MDQKAEPVPKWMEAILKAIWGTDAETRRARSKEDVLAKIGEAHVSIDKLSESTDRLARLSPAHNLDEAIRQLTEGE